ncbi:MAG: sigma-54-dependent Fis family transcriptional regulator [Bdellovibrionaceae bacterium]|nr:sigma-54-dependent Fis family transcriptional regulator [Pseudobdellovibrionaceae bacterium]
MKPTRVLILDDESTLRTALFRLLDRKGFQVVTAQRIDEARAFMSPDKPFDIAIIDMNLPDGNGLDFISEIKNQSPQTQVVVLTGFATIDSAIQATQKGAYHFLTKPFNVEELMGLLDKALSHRNLEQENKQLRNELGTRYQFDQIIGESEGIKTCLSLVERVANSDSTILVMGESGTGKELIARAIHYNSPRAKGPFIAINCGAIPSELLESELFGHIKGAFTGAISNRIGRFELADEGTLFLDEIGDLDPSMQVKILRALQERMFEPVGSTKSVQVNVRVIAATNVDMERAVKEGKFREDLYYRLNVIPILIPSLRERKTDIPLLLSHFMTQFNRTKVRSLTGFSQDALNCLVNYAWPGNIRELENLIERLSILKGAGQVEVLDLPPKYKSTAASYAETGSVEIPETGLDFNTAVDQFENALILKALEKTGWNKNQAALLLRLNRTTLVEKMKKKGLKSNEPELDM